jgi:hypothetical protein
MARKQQQKKRDITLMTVLAYEATDSAQKLLKKYGREEAKGYNDLEVKLANLYFDPSIDKVKFEKELADIHPHKLWLLENSAPVVTIEQKEVEIETKPTPEQQKEIEDLKKLLDAEKESKKMNEFKEDLKKALQEEINRNNNVSQGTMGGNPFYSQTPFTAPQMYSGFAGTVEKETEKKDNTMAIVGLVSITAISSIVLLTIFTKLGKQ